jgi:hypothetical protein
MKKIQKLVTQIGKRIALMPKQEMRKLLLISTIFSVLVLSWVLPRWTAPQNCISSTFVEQISFSGGSESIKKCDLRTRTLSKTPDSWIQQTTLISRINRLDALIYLLPEPMSRVQIMIAEEDPDQLTLSANLIQIGKNQIMRPTVLERALITYWFGHRDPLASQVIADFVWSYMRGETKKISRAEPWLMSYSGLATYCSKRGNLMAHEEYCSLQRELGDGLVSDYDDEAGVVWSLHPIYTKLLARIFLNSSVENQQKLIKRLVFINSFEDLGEFLSAKTYLGLEDLDLGFQKSVASAFAPLGLSQVEIDEAVEPFLMRNARELPYLVFGDDIDGDQAVSLPNSIVESGAAKRIYPSRLTSHISRQDIFKYLDVREVVFVGCYPPQVKHLLEFEDYTNKITFIRMCDAKGDDLKRILYFGTESFLRLHPKTEFIEFNLKALKVAQRIKGLPSEEFVDLSDLTNWIESQGSSFDSSKQAYRPHSAFAAVSWYRWN